MKGRAEMAAMSMGEDEWYIGIWKGEEKEKRGGRESSDKSEKSFQRQQESPEFLGGEGPTDGGAKFY